MKAIVSRTIQHAVTPITLEEVDISTDPNLERLYGTEIPVLMVNGKKIAKYRVTEGELRRRLDDRSRG
jgi:hypothetical protein